MNIKKMSVVQYFVHKKCSKKDMKTMTSEQKKVQIVILSICFKVVLCGSDGAMSSYLSSMNTTSRDHTACGSMAYP